MVILMLNILKRKILKYSVNDIDNIQLVGKDTHLSPNLWILFLFF